MADQTTALGHTLRDAFYVTVGFGVIAVQRAQVQRRELAKLLDTQLTETREQVTRLAREVEERVEPVLDELEHRLPEQARELVRQAREAGRRYRGGNGAAPSPSAA